MNNHCPLPTPADSLHPAADGTLDYMHTSRSGLGPRTAWRINSIPRLRNILCISHGQKRDHVLDQPDLE